MSKYNKTVLTNTGLDLAIKAARGKTKPVLNGTDGDIALTFNNQTSELPILGEVVLDG